MDAEEFVEQHAILQRCRFTEWIASRSLIEGYYLAMKPQFDLKQFL